MNVQGNAVGRQLVRLALLAVAVLAAVAGLAVLRATPAAAHAGHDHLLCTPVRGLKNLCTHGPDKPPKGVDLERRVTDKELQRRAATGSYDATSAGYTASATTVPKVACIGDGKSGPRVQAIYARAKDRPDRFSTALPLIQKYAAIADSYVNRSAAQVRSGRRIRYVTENCKVKVVRVTVPAGADDSFGATAQALAKRGYNKDNRKYLIWMEANVLCGVGSTATDDRDTPSNANNQYTGFARVDRSCWGGGVEAHELFHTFGAVQDSAPHSNKAGHCFDEYDAMCYADGSGVKMRVLCASAFEWQIDCGHDDYFNPKPKAGTYLANKWNTADSRYLEPSIAPPTEPVVSLPSAANRLPGLKWSLSATSNASGSRTIARWKWEAVNAYSGAAIPQCQFSSSTVASPKFWCDAAAGGSFRMITTVWDNTGLSNAKVTNITLAQPSTKRSTTLIMTTTPTSLPVGGGSVKVVAKLLDTATGKPIIGMPLQMAAMNPQTYDSALLANTTTNTTGLVTRNHIATADTRYSADTWSTQVWKDASAARTVTVPLPPLTTVSAAFAESTVAPWSDATLTGVMAPRDPGASSVQLQKLGSDGQWDDVASAPVASGGGFTFASWYFDTSVEGVSEYRVVKPAGTYQRTVTDVLTLTVAKVEPTITLGTTQTRNTDGSVTLSGTISPKAAAGSLRVDRQTGPGTWQEGAGRVEPVYDANWSPTGAFTMTVSQQADDPQHVFRAIVPPSTQYLVSEVPFEVTFTTTAATIVVDPTRTPGEWGAMALTGSVTPAAAVNNLQVESWNGTTWVPEWGLSPRYDSAWNPTGVFDLTLCHPTGGSGTVQYRVVMGSNWTYTATPYPFSVVYP